jgi:hypothetical protein
LGQDCGQEREQEQIANVKANATAKAETTRAQLLLTKISSAISLPVETLPTVIMLLLLQMTATLIRATTSAIMLKEASSSSRESCSSRRSDSGNCRDNKASAGNGSSDQY